MKTAAKERWPIVGEYRVVGTENFGQYLVVHKGNDILILDITVSFENDIVADEEARKAKLQKYNNLATELLVNGKNTIVEAIVVEALRSWDPVNDKFLRRLCAKCYLKDMKKKSKLAKP